MVRCFYITIQKTHEIYEFTDTIRDHWQTNQGDLIDFVIVHKNFYSPHEEKTIG